MARAEVFLVHGPIRAYRSTGNQSIARKGSFDDDDSCAYLAYGAREVWVAADALRRVAGRRN